MRETVPHFPPTLKTLRWQPPRAGALKLSPAESKWTSNSFCCALPCGADIRPSAVASRRPRGQEQSACYLHDLGPLMALPSRRGASHACVDLQNTTSVAPPVGPGGAPGVRNGALASARCTFYLKMMFPPQRGAHFPHLGGHEHHLGSSELSSRCCAVRVLKNELSLQRGALFYTHL